jgi:proteasome accessory factor C
MSGKRGPRSVEDRVKGLLVMLPWLMKRESVKISEMAAEFDINEQDLIEDIEMASMCGIPPYTPFELTDMYIDEGYIFVGSNKRFDRSLTLTPSEAFGLGLLAAAAQELPGFERGKELKSAMKKLRKVLGDGLIDIDVESPKFLGEVTSACHTGERLVITYWTPSRNEESTRNVVVRTVFADRGHWYISADDDVSGSRRTFRVDRIRDVKPTGQFVEVISEAASVPNWFVDASDMTTVVLEVSPAAAWVIETYPCTVKEERPDGSTRIELAVSSAHWLGRLLLRAGDGVTVVSPPEMVSMQQQVAREVLALYASSSDN